MEHVEIGQRVYYVSRKTGDNIVCIVDAVTYYPSGEARDVKVHKESEPHKVWTFDADWLNPVTPETDLRPHAEVIAEARAKLVAKRATQAKTYRYVCLECGSKTNRSICQCGGDTLLNTDNDGDNSMLLDH